MIWGWGLGRGDRGWHSWEREHLNRDPKNELELDIPKGGFSTTEQRGEREPRWCMWGGEAGWENLAPQILPTGMQAGKKREKEGEPRQGRHVEPTCPQHQTGDLCEPEEGHTAGVAQAGRTWRQSPNPHGRPFPCGGLCPALPDTPIFPEKPYVGICRQSFQIYRHWLCWKFILKKKKHCASQAKPIIPQASGEAGF